MHSLANVLGLHVEPVPRPAAGVDELHMRRALKLAWRAVGDTRPNPIVGAVVLSDGVVAGESYHRRCGGPHAEVPALEAAGGQARGATLYVTLEPCTHHGRTPPRVDAVIASGVRFTGVTVHLADEEYDHGPIVDQVIVPVHQDDTPDSLQQRVLKEEHRLYPDVIRLFAEGRVSVDGRRVTISGR